MAKTESERAREYRQRKRDAVTESSVTVRHENVTIQERDAPDVSSRTGPLSVYSDRRWAYLKAKGYVWVEEEQRAYRPGDGRNGLIMGVTVPGDPAYKDTESLSKAG